MANTGPPQAKISQKKALILIAYHQKREETVLWRLIFPIGEYYFASFCGHSMDYMHVDTIHVYSPFIAWLITINDCVLSALICCISIPKYMSNGISVKFEDETEFSKIWNGKCYFVKRKIIPSISAADQA